MSTTITARTATPCDTVRPCLSAAQETVVCALSAAVVSAAGIRRLDGVTGQRLEQRVFEILIALSRCAEHRPTDVSIEPAVLGRLEAAMLGYVHASDALRHSRGRDFERLIGEQVRARFTLVRNAQWAVRDFHRRLLADTDYTARPDRKARSFRTAAGARLLTDEQAEIFKILARGLVAGEAVAARTMLGADVAESLAYLRRVATSNYRSGVSGGGSLLVDLSDAELTASLRGFINRATWVVARSQDRQVYADLVGRAREIQTVSVDLAGGQPDATAQPVVRENVFAGSADTVIDDGTELSLWLAVRESGYCLGQRRFTAAERDKIDARIEFLRDLH